MKELECGRILNTHGVRGELKIDPYCDMPVLRKLETVYLDGVPYKMLTCRPHNTFALMTLEGITNIINHPKLVHLPFYLETPNDEAGYGKEIAMLRSVYHDS